MVWPTTGRHLGLRTSIQTAWQVFLGPVPVYCQIPPDLGSDHIMRSCSGAMEPSIPVPITPKVIRNYEDEPEGFQQMTIV
ncbi:hypothetical protein BJX64DRAFT_270168, partial [Aspergillus heterothallicus]